MKLQDTPCHGPECDRPSLAHIEGHPYCSSHYAQFRRTGRFAPLQKHYGQRYSSLEDALLSRRTITDDGCWIWTGCLRPDGYGQLEYQRQSLVAHRAAYELYVRPLAPREVVHHTCHNRACFNPDHLQSATQRENSLEMLERRSLLARISYLESRLAEYE